MKIMGFLMLMFYFLTLASCSSSKPSTPQKKPESIVIPVSILGKESETRRKFLQNTLNEELSKQFRIVPQKRGLQRNTGAHVSMPEALPLFSQSLTRTHARTHQDGG